MSDSNKEEILQDLENMKINETTVNHEEKPEEKTIQAIINFNVASINTGKEYSIDDINKHVKSIIKLYNVEIIFWQEFKYSLDALVFDWLFGNDSNYLWNIIQETNDNTYNIVFFNKNNFEEFKNFEYNAILEEYLENRFSWLALKHRNSREIFLVASIHNFNNIIKNQITSNNANNNNNNNQIQEPKNGRMSSEDKLTYLQRIFTFLITVRLKIKQKATILIGADANGTWKFERSLKKFEMELEYFIDSKKNIDYILLFKQNGSRLTLKDPDCPECEIVKFLKKLENFKTKISELSLNLTENNATANSTSDLFQEYEEIYQQSKKFVNIYEIAKKGNKENMIFLK